MKVGMGIKSIPGWEKAFPEARREGQTDGSDAEFKGHIHLPDSA